MQKNSVIYQVKKSYCADNKAILCLLTCFFACGIIFNRERGFSLSTKENEATTVKPYEELDFTDDFMFCRVLSENPSICKHLAELVTGRKIERIGEVNEQKPVKITKDGKGVRFDIYFKDGNGTAYDFEAQNVRKYNEARRARYYLSLNDMSLLLKGGKYKDLPDCYIVFICSFDPFNMGLYKYTFENRCVEEPELALEDGSKKVFLNAAGIRGDIPDEMKEFLEYFRTHQPGGDFTGAIDDAVKTQRDNENGRLDYMMLSDIYDEFKEACREEGREEGREELIIQALKSGNSAEQVADFLKLPVEEVKRIEEKILAKA
jgi:predicted transposase/invertase (TIGR01784 family)